MKYILKEKAIALRREGLTYSEILKQVSVAKSTLTEWFHSVNLAEHQNQRITEKRIASAKREAKQNENKELKELSRYLTNFGQKKIGISPEYFSHIYFKKANIKTKRKNVDTTYFGLMKLKVRSSSILHRKIAGWTQGVVESFR